MQIKITRRDTCQIRNYYYINEKGEIVIIYQFFFVVYRYVQSQLAISSFKINTLLESNVDKVFERFFISRDPSTFNERASHRKSCNASKAPLAGSRVARRQIANYIRGVGTRA